MVGGGGGVSNGQGEVLEQGHFFVWGSSSSSSSDPSFFLSCSIAKPPNRTNDMNCQAFPFA